jgi:hypothetical protein
MVSGNIVSALLALWLFRSSDWQHAVVPTAAAGQRGAGPPPEKAEGQINSDA